MNDWPLLSICVLTYNHEKYIRDCLEGIFNQETDFTFEVLINDDASTDNTLKIIQEYEKKYPGIIKLVKHRENQYSKGITSMVNRFLIPKAKGKYLALCEGDDYWTDPHKLQLQVDYMEKHPNCSLCFHRTRVDIEMKIKNNIKTIKEYPETLKRRYTVVDDIINNYNIHTTSFIVRKLESYNNYTDRPIFSGDIYFMAFHARGGYIHFINREMSVYRRNENGISTSMINDIQGHWDRNIEKTFTGYVEIRSLFSSKSKEYNSVSINIYSLIDRIIRESVQSEKLIKRILVIQPNLMVEYIESLLKDSRSLKQEVDRLNDILNKNSHTIHTKDVEINSVNRELSSFLSIKRSIKLVVGNVLRYIKRKI